MLVNFDAFYPSANRQPKKHESENSTGHGLLGKFGVCGKEIPRGDWVYYSFLFYFDELCAFFPYNLMIQENYLIFI